MSEGTLRPIVQLMKVLPVAVVASALTLFGAYLKDRTETEHVTTQATIRIQNLELRVADLATKDELRTALHGIEQRLDDQRDILLDVQASRRR